VAVGAEALLKSSEMIPSFGEAILTRMESMIYQIKNSRFRRVVSSQKTVFKNNQNLRDRK
jgi:hypothetical protein